MPHSIEFVIAQRNSQSDCYLKFFPAISIKIARQLTNQIGETMYRMSLQVESHVTKINEPAYIRYFQSIIHVLQPKPNKVSYKSVQNWPSVIQKRIKYFLYKYLFFIPYLFLNHFQSFQSLRY